MKPGTLIMTLLQIMLLISCRSEVALDKEEFTNVLIRLHVTDAMLKNSGIIGKGPMDEKEVYSYYGGIFKDYGIDKNTFDSCLSYYSRNTEEFLNIYSVVLDSLNRRLTKVNKKLSLLKSKDTLNLLEVRNPLYISLYDTSTIFDYGEVEEGVYSFSMKFKPDSLRKNYDSKIVSYFLRDRFVDTVYSIDSIWYSRTFIRLDSVFTVLAVMDPSTESSAPSLYDIDSVFSYERHCNTFEIKERRRLSDTFRLRTMTLYPDTNFRYYTWRQYVDSSFNRVCVKYVRDGVGGEDIGDAELNNVRLTRVYESDEEMVPLKKSFKYSSRMNIFKSLSYKIIERSATLLKKN